MKDKVISFYKTKDNIDITKLNQKKNTTVKRLWFEIPNKYKKIFESKIVKLCREWDIRIL